jgi:aspartate/methionine/tyrosine aminotransferase
MSIRDFKLERYFAQYEFSSRFLLCSSDPETWSVRDILDLEPGSADAFLDLPLSYTPSNGSPALRREAARIYSTIDPEQVLMFAGAEEGIFCFVHALLQKGDHLVVHSPCFQSHREVAVSLGVDVSLWEAREASGWKLDVDELKSLLMPSTKAVVLNIPHNPTGCLMDEDRFRAVVTICDERGIILFSDEVFRESEMDPTRRLPAACDLSPTAFSLGVLSKSYGLPGLRIGWLATQHRQALRRVAAFKDYTTICNSGPSEFIATIALRHREALLKRTMTLLRSHLELLDGFFERQAGRMSWIRPSASPMAFPRLRLGDSDRFCDQLVRETGVLLLPGSVYDVPGGHFRIGFGRKNFPDALGVMEDWIEAGWNR